MDIIGSRVPVDRLYRYNLHVTLGTIEPFSSENLREKSSSKHTHTITIISNILCHHCQNTPTRRETRRRTRKFSNFRVFLHWNLIILHWISSLPAFALVCFALRIASDDYQSCTWLLPFSRNSKPPKNNNWLYTIIQYSYCCLSLRGSIAKPTICHCLSTAAAKSFISGTFISGTWVVVVVVVVVNHHNHHQNHHHHPRTWDNLIRSYWI